MKPYPYPDWIDHIWAKSPDKGEGGQAETLAQHTWAVLQRQAEFIRLRPRLSQLIERPDLWHLLFWASFFHDFGKAVPAFQGVLRNEEGGRSLWGKHRHEVFSLAFLGWAAADLSPEQLQWIAAAVVSHHRDPEEIANLYPHVEEGDIDPLSAHILAIDEKTLSGLWRWLVECSPEWIRLLDLERVGVCPLTIMCEQESIQYIRSQGVRQIRAMLRAYRRFTRGLLDEEQSLLVSALTLRGHIINSDHGGSAHVEPMPVLRFTPQVVYETRKLSPETLYSHQREAGEIEGSALLVAPTGSGKTEAALLWAARQLQHEEVAPRLFYTLPYQASMNAMKIRLGGQFGDDLVALQHGRGLLSLYRQLMERAYTQEEAARTARHMKNLARLNHTPIRVFSPYQMLKGMYRLKGYEAQLSDYHSALFIFDEIHAYEVRRLAMILKTMAYLRKCFHARFFVMSATFPDLIQGWLEDALDGPVSIQASEELFRKFQRHRLYVLEGDLLEEKNIQQIADDAKDGKSVLVVCNIVARAQQAYEALQRLLNGEDIPVRLLHGRFNLVDRSEKEKFIQEKAATRREKHSPVVLVATQVVEVSLDIDLNTIYTDPAPLEALIQRFGRVNRGRKIKPYAPVHVFTKPDDGQKIYNPAVIARALEILRSANGQPIDESQIGSWLNNIYTGEIAMQWQREYEAAAKEFDDICISTLRPFDTAGDELEDRFNNMFDGVEVLPESLYEQYERLRENEPIAASTLLVPMRWGQYHALANKGLIKPGDRSMPPIALSGYSSELGLTFERQSVPDEWD